MFEETQCDLCGECLVRCPELHLSEQEAKVEMQRLIQSREPPSTLTRCSSCFSCNSYCPRDCNPYDLILSRWNERYQREGSPPVWKFLCPNRDDQSLEHAARDPAGKRQGHRRRRG